MPSRRRCKITHSPWNDQINPRFFRVDRPFLTGEAALRRNFGLNIEAMAALSAASTTDSPRKTMSIDTVVQHAANKRKAPLLTGIKVRRPRGSHAVDALLII